MTTAADVGKWMAEEFEQYGELDQENAAWDIKNRYGDEFVTETESGGFSINNDVRDEFHRYTEGKAHWDRGSKRWVRMDD